MTGTVVDQILGISDTLQSVNNPAGINEMLHHVDRIVANPQTPTLKKRMAGVIGEVLQEARRRNARPGNPLDVLVEAANRRENGNVSRLKFGDVRYFTLHDTDAVSVIKVRVVNLDENHAAVITESGHSYFVDLDQLHTSPQEAWSQGHNL